LAPQVLELRLAACMHVDVQQPRIPSHAMAVHGDSQTFLSHFQMLVVEK
jgi:hypothetical protein